MHEMMLINMCLNGNYTKVRKDKNLSDAFPIRNGRHCF